MHRQKKRPGDGSGKEFRRPEILAPEQSDQSRLSVILASGFGVARDYNNVSRDRHYVHLGEGVTPHQLLVFCRAYLHGRPMPRSDPISDGPLLLAIFEAAQAVGLVTVEFVPAGPFLPERK